jgi:hypothetical protein
MMITQQGLEELIYDKLEHLRRIKRELRDNRRELRKVKGIVRSQLRKRIYWTSEQRRETALEGVIENQEILVKELEKGINVLYQDLREMGG